MSRLVKAAKHLKFSSEPGHGHSDDSPEPGRSYPDGSWTSNATVDDIGAGARLSNDEENIILLGKPALHKDTMAVSPEKQQKRPGSHDKKIERSSPSKTPSDPSVRPPSTESMPMATTPAIGEGSLKLEHLIPGDTVTDLAMLHPKSPSLNPQGQHDNNSGINDLPDIAVEMASPPDLGSTSPHPPDSRRLSGISDVSDDDRRRTRPRSASNLSTGSDTDRGTRPRSISAVRLPAISPRRSGSSPSASQNSSPYTKPRSLTVGSRNSASNGIAGALAMSGFTLGAPGSAGHPGMSFQPGQHPWVTGPAPPLPPRSRASSLEELGDGDDEMAGMGSLDSQMGDFGYIDDVDLGSGYALAGIKRNQEFHQLFETVPEHDALIEDYGCALWKDILTQGRLYISEHHLCFYANILGWITNLVVPFSEVISIEKRMTAYVIPNAITVKTLHVHHTFASFLSRDTTYALIVDIWSKSHPNIPPGAALPDHGLEEESAVEEEVALVDEQAPPKEKKSRLRMRRGGKASAAAPSVSDAQANANAALRPPSPLPTPPTKKATTTHRPTQVPASVTMFKDVCMDATFAGSPEKIYNLMFTSEGFMRDFWANNMKLTEIEIGEWKPSEKQILERTVSYIKPLNGPVGPKSMKCYITDANENVDFDDYISVLTTTRTPDAPSGNAFSTKTRSCFTWAANNCCRVQVTTTVEWTKSSLLKGVITSSALDGQKQYHTELVKVIKAYMHAHKSEFQHSSGGEDISDNVADAVDEQPVIEPSELSRAPKSAIMQVLEPAIDLVKGAADMVVDLALSNLITTSIIVLLLVFNVWTLFSRTGSDIDNIPGSRTRAPPGSHLRSGDEVAEAVTRVLQEYFAPPHLHKGPSSQTTSVPVSEQKGNLDPTVELAEIYGALEDLESRVARLRTLLAEHEGR